MSWEILKIYKYGFEIYKFKITKYFFRDTPFVVFLWSQNAVNDTQFQLLSLTAERKQVEDRVVRCINVLLDQDVSNKTRK